MDVVENAAARKGKPPKDASDGGLDLGPISESSVEDFRSDCVELASPEELSYDADLLSAEKQLQKTAFYLNVLTEAYYNADSVEPEQFRKLVSKIKDKLWSTMTFYRVAARSLAIRSRTAQESQQTANELPSAQLAKLERLRAELERAKSSVNKLVSPDYSVFNDLKMISSDELMKLNPGLLSDSSTWSPSESQHHILLAQMTHEHERRRHLMSEIETLTRKKRTLQDEVKKRREAMNVVNIDVDRTRGVLEALALKLNMDVADFQRDIGEIESTVMYALQEIQDTTHEETPASVEVENMEVAEILTPEAISNEAIEVDEVPDVAREEGEASDEAEDDPVESSS